MFKYLEELNGPQREAVLHTDGPLMIIAGAGSGKTKVLTTRITHLMASHKVDAFNILALTFTNKAAAEMKERVEKTMGNTEARNLYIGTFHSVFARILRAEATKLGYPSNFTIYDTDDAKSVVKAVINELGLDDKNYKPNTIYNRISSAKNNLVRAEEYAADQQLIQEDARINKPMFHKIYLNYSNRCFKNGAMDFDDLLLNMHTLLTRFPEALSKYQRKFKYILIDEYQDTNPAQYEIVKLLGAMHENVCVVGDDAQSIYSFRGATIQNILQFNKDYDEVKVIKLEQNYRSTKNILHVANQVISNNKGQIEKKLFTDNVEGDKINLIRTQTDNDEGRMVADTIQDLKLRKHFFNRDFAILYRTNAQSRSFEEALRRMGIAYKIYGGMSFYQRKEVKDMLAYLRVVVNPNDEEALKRIINYPGRGIGKTTMERAILAANTNNVSMWDVLTRASMYGFRASTLEALQDFVTMIQMFQSELSKKNAYDIAFMVGKDTGLVKELFNDKSVEGLQRYENVQELLNSIKEFTETPMNTEDGEVGEKDLGAYLQQIALLTDPAEQEQDGDVVKLMTIHASKGLEFPVVFVGGLEETIFPNAMAINTREDLEEERRLFYVAVTRAKKLLYLSFANARYRFGQLQQNESSRFLEEIPQEYIDYKLAGSSSRAQSSNMGSAYERMHRGFAKPSEPKREGSNVYSSLSARPKTVEHVPSENFVASDLKALRAGQKVEHLKFGFGEVTKMEGAAHNPIATIQFKLNGEKKIMLNYAKLRILDDE
ncbi:MAG TPA: 3'-5' exonuclease [Ferruginibacter sp.]|nr:UvrD-helicase domain-containing protein [Ferruginibacter sp.]HRO16784.1 3'-5' exonuclease [Ferruginibacter sp.]HRQ20320.1 3'-5' exonuclease [Ferruginibacter sp.]